MTHDDRRLFARADAEISCKLRRDARTMFTPGRTSNISPGGVAVELLGPRPVRVGERVAVAFEHPLHPIAHAAHMVTATVVRADPAHDGLLSSPQRVALRFDTPQFGLDSPAVQVAA